MRILILAGMALALSACSSKLKQAQDHYDLVKATGTPAELCVAGRALAVAHYQYGDRQDYELWRVMSSSQCLMVEMGI